MNNNSKSNSGFDPKKSPRPMGMGHGGPMGLMKGDKAKDFSGTMKRLISYLGQYKIGTVIAIILAFLSTVFTIFGPRILGNATTTVFKGAVANMTGAGTGMDFESIRNALLLALGLYLLSAAFGFVQGWVMTGISVDITYRLRKDISEKINRLPLRYFDSTTHGEVLSRITNDVDTVNQTLSQSLSQIINSIVTVFGVLVMMFLISWQMTIIALLMVPLSMFFVQFIVKRSQKYFRQQQDYLGHVNGHIEEMFSGHTEVKAFNQEAVSIGTFRGFNDTLYLTAWKSQFLSGIIMPVMFFIGNLGYAAVVVFGGWLALRGVIQVGDIQAFVQYVRSFTQPITQLANISNILQQTAAAAERVFEFLDEEDQIQETDQPVVLPRATGKVEFRNVAFGYKADKQIIHSFSEEIEPGKKVAIVGPTGAGKTTIVKLLMRYYDVTDGAILIDDVDIRNLKRDELRRQFAMVLQDTWLFNGTLFDNIRYGDLNASDEDVIAASKAAHADHFIRALPNGYDMVLNEDTSNISAGQKQLLTIARAFLVDPPMLILDEATSSVDTHTELLIQKAMKDLMKGRTSFIIAHRLSTIRDADLILVMNEGNIIEQGKHEELLKEGGFYASLYNSQFAAIA